MIVIVEMLVILMPAMVEDIDGSNGYSGDMVKVVMIKVMIIITVTMIIVIIAMVIVKMMIAMDDSDYYDSDEKESDSNNDRMITYDGIFGCQLGA